MADASTLADERRGSSGLLSAVGADIDSASIAQMRAACSLPVAAAGPDARCSCWIWSPDRGVLATRGAVIPYAVGVDIACRVRLECLGMAPEALGHEHVRKQFRRAIEEETRFGVGARVFAAAAACGAGPRLGFARYVPGKGQGVEAARHERER